MAGATLVSTGDRITNNTTMKCGVLGAYNLPLVEWTRLIDTDTPKPGHILANKTAAGGEDVVILHDLKRADAMYLAEFDPGLVATTATAYAATDEIPILPLFMNPGAICRNVHGSNPAADINAGWPLIGSPTTSGLVEAAVEATFSPCSATGHFGWQTATLGTNAAAGAIVLSRAVAVQMYFLTDPSAAYTDVVSLLWCK